MSTSGFKEKMVATKINVSIMITDKIPTIIHYLSFWCSNWAHELLTESCHAPTSFFWAALGWGNSYLHENNRAEYKQQPYSIISNSKNEYLLHKVSHGTVLYKILWCLQC